ncbi:hypothetical protein LINGRAHAP2_LOCUS33006 [Linum grandiflorum]
MATVAGLPRFVVFRAKFNGKYVHYLTDKTDVHEYYQCMGVKKDLDRCDPLVKIEVVQSKTDKSLVHLKCCYSNKYLMGHKMHGVVFMSATADTPNEDQKSEACTLFKPMFLPNDPKTVRMLFVQNNCHLMVFYNKEYGPVINGVVCAYVNDGLNNWHHFEVIPWATLDEILVKKDKDIADRDRELEVKEKEIKYRDEIIKKKEEEIKQVAAKERKSKEIEGELQSLKAKVADFKDALKDVLNYRG